MPFQSLAASHHTRACSVMSSGRRSIPYSERNVTSNEEVPPAQVSCVDITTSPAVRVIHCPRGIARHVHDDDHRFDRVELDRWPHKPVIFLDVLDRTSPRRFRCMGIDRDREQTLATACIRNTNPKKPPRVDVVPDRARIQCSKRSDERLQRRDLYVREFSFSHGAAPLGLQQYQGAVPLACADSQTFSPGQLNESHVLPTGTQHRAYGMLAKHTIPGTPPLHAL